MPIAIIDHVECHYQDIGEGHTLLFGHSYLWTSDMWKPQLKELSKHFRCIAVDLWNHGQSGDLKAETRSLEDISEDYWGLMQHLGISEFSVVGLSIGGMWGTHLALNHKEAVKSLVLMDTFLGIEPEETKVKYFSMLDAIDAANCFPEPLVDQIVPLFFSPYTLSHNKELVKDFRNSLLNYDVSKLKGLTKIGRMVFTRENLLLRFHEITQPSLVFVGRDDLPRPVHEAEEMAKLLPNSKLHIIENAGHICNLENPEAVTPLLKDFFQSHIVSPSIP